MSKFRANIFLIQTTSNYLWASEVEVVKVDYRISANSYRGNYSFLKVGVRKVFKGGNYSRAETILFWKLECS